MIKVTILGNNSAIPAYGRHPTAQIVEMRDQLFLMDCGEGTQIQLQRFNIRNRRINHVFISHLHGDHYFGLIGLITSMGLLNRTAPLHIFGPEGLQDIIDLHFSVSGAQLPYELVFTPIFPGQVGLLLESDHYSVKCFPVEHRIPCHGFVFTLKNQGRKIIPEQCEAYDIPTAFYNALKKGDDYLRADGFLVKNEWVTSSAPPEKKYAYCADTRFTDSFIPYIKDVDLVYHESTYLKDNEVKATERFHSTAEQAAKVALLSNAKKLLLGHYSSRYRDLEAFVLEASAIFPQVEISIEGMTYTV